MNGWSAGSRGRNVTSMAPERLGPVPDGFATTRDALHRLAEDVLSPQQSAVNGDIHFEAWPGGFATPEFGAGRRLMVEGAHVVEVEGGEEVRRDPIPGVEEAAAHWLGELFAFGEALLGELDADEPIRLWPEHFDIATVVGRATYGVSPGDRQHDEPYLYVSSWDGRQVNGVGFSGAELAAPGLSLAEGRAFFAGWSD
jgi:hypothetical protein